MDETDAIKMEDIVTNRLALLSEFEFIYMNDYGFRVSAVI